jgi:type IV pilus assembly protein PilO
MPKLDEITNLESQQTQKQEDLNLVKTKVSSLDALKKQSAELKAELDRAKKALPEGPEIPELIKDISETGRKVGLEISRFQPLAESFSDTNDFVAEVPIALAVEGSYHQVAMFFDRLAKMDRIVQIKDIDMEIAEEALSNVSLLVEGRAITFRFLSDDERKERMKKKKKGKKRGRR